MLVSDIHATSRAALADRSPSYREFPPPPELAHFLECLWTREQPEPEGYSRVVPDACIDLIWVGPDELLIAGPATRAVIAELPAGSSIAGIRFRTGVAPAVFGVPADALLDMHIPLDAIWPRESREIVERAEGCEDAVTRLAILGDALYGRLRREYQADELVQAGAALLQTDSGLTVRELGVRLGASERQLLRRFDAAVGYGPKTLARILRFQTALDFLSEHGRSGSLATVAQVASYADQPHMTREFVRLAGATPGLLTIASRKKSDSFNTEPDRRS